MSEKEYVSGLLIIAAGALAFFILFLFAQRQIFRFKLRSSKLHITIGSNAPKAMKHEIMRRLKRVPEIKYEPLLLNERMRDLTSDVPGQYYYRMKAVDSFNKLADLLISEDSTVDARNPSQTVRQYLLSLYPKHLTFSSADLIHQFSDAYDHARHDPAEFAEAEYNNYMGLLDELITCVKLNNCNRGDRDCIDMDSKFDTEVTFRQNRGGGNKCETKAVTSTSSSSSDRLVPESIELRERSLSPGSIGPDSGLSSKHSSMDRSSGFKGSAEKIVLIGADG